MLFAALIAVAVLAVWAAIMLVIMYLLKGKDK